MMVLIIGGSGSGKSAYAEECIDALSKECRKYYIATMQAFDGEGQARIERHRRMRSGKGFWTIEQPLAVEEALNEIRQSSSGSTALLECVTNLAANEMFAKDEAQPCEAVAEKIVQGVAKLQNGLKHLVIVSGNVFEDGIRYDEAVSEYIRAMGSINEKLAMAADRVIEVAAGIPIVIKEQK